MARLFAVLPLTLAIAASVPPIAVAQRRTTPKPVAAAPQKPTAAAPFTTPLTVAQMTGKQAVVNTTAGSFVIDLRPDLAPNHVGYFIKLAGEGAFNGTVFHRVIRLGIIQGGDPLSKDPAKAQLYGTGGLGLLKAELNAERTTRGAVAAVLQPSRPDSGGAQFFVCVTDQPSLDGKYTVFGRVSDGMDVVQKISEAPASADGRPNERIEIVSATIRDAPPPEPEPFSTETPAELARYRAVLDTTAGPITIEFFSDRAPEHVRNFLRLAQAGVFDGTSFHRVVPGFVVQTGSLGSRGPLTEKQQKYVRALQPEFNDTKHVKGIISMARGDDPASATTSFFIVTGDASSLDGKYTAFGRVVDGIAAVEAIERTPVNGETPAVRIDLEGVRLVKGQ
jgi:peptidyl-prolyl cis-trans isomerase B (cyclophilin B)